MENGGTCASVMASKERTWREGYGYVGYVSDSYDDEEGQFPVSPKPDILNYRGWLVVGDCGGDEKPILHYIQNILRHLHYQDCRVQDIKRLKCLVQMQCLVFRLGSTLISGFSPWPYTERDITGRLAPVCITMPSSPISVKVA